MDPVEGYKAVQLERKVEKASEARMGCVTPAPAKKENDDVDGNMGADVTSPPRPRQMKDSPFQVHRSCPTVPT
jgi:hypothetical protein